MNKTKLAERRKSLVSVIYSITGLLGLLVFLAVVASVYLSVQIYYSTDNLIENTLPDYEAINKARTHSEAASDLLTQIPQAKSVQELLDSMIVLSKISLLIEKCLQLIESVGETQNIEHVAERYNALLELNKQQIEYFQLLVKNTRLALVARTELYQVLNSGKKMFGAAVIEVEKKTLSAPLKDPKNTLHMMQRLLQTQNIFEVLNANIAQLSLAKDEAQAHKIIESYHENIRKAIEGISDKDIQWADDNIHSLATDRLSILDSANSYEKLRLEQLRIAYQIRSLNQEMRKTFQDVFYDLRALSENAREVYGDGISSAKRVSTLAVVLSLFVFFLFMFILSVAYFYALPKRIVRPLRDAVKAIISVGESGDAYQPFDTSLLELYEIDRALALFRENAQTLKFNQGQLAEQKNQLKKFEEEIKTFTRVSSHDLKSPLRGISLLCKMILEDMADQDYKEAEENVNKIDARVSRLFNLLDSLLAFIKAGDNMRIDHKLAVSEVVNAQIDLLHKPPGIKVHISVECPQLMVSEAPFAMILRNLVDNAIKHHNQEEGQVWVHVGMKSQDLLVLTVKDDGPGVPIHYQNRIFEPFETLKPKDLVEGSGMGLAIISKMVEKVGGTVRLKSPIDGNIGACFTVEWPV